MLASEIEDAVKQRWDTGTFGATDWNQLIPRAARFYSRYNPRMVETELTTVSDQSEYDLPAGTILVTKVLWYKGTEVSAQLLAGSEAFVLEPRRRLPNMPSDDVINDINEEALLKLMQGDWEQWKGNGQLHISPTPTVAGNTIYVTYTANHVSTVSGTTYATIPDQDLDIMADLVLAYHLEKQASRHAAEPNWSLGQQRETRHHVPGNAMLMVSQLRSECISKYGGVAAVAAP